ncbi:MAG: tRNA-modifying protein YgfZ [Candidatus Dasytiphilus stammeri]
MKFYNSNTIFPQSSMNLAFTFIFLEQWTLLTITGRDYIDYLQGQLTLDIKKLKLNQSCQSAHCNARGKMLTNLLLFHYGEGLGWIVRSSVHQLQLAALKKYAIFSQVLISKNDKAILLGIAGFKARETLTNFYSVLPNKDCPVIHFNHTLLLWFNRPSERFIIITDINMVKKLISKLLDIKAHFNDSRQWVALDIEAGIPIIDVTNSCKFLPQATNLQNLNGISFNKGCYLGQEMVTRAKFRGVNKHALYLLSGHSNYIPDTTDYLELQISNDQWKESGTILASCLMANNELWIQAILKNNLPLDSVLRLKKDGNSSLSIQKVFY